MVDDLEERLSRYRADLDAAVAADLAHRQLTSREAGSNDADPLLRDLDHPIRLEPTTSARYDRRSMMLVAILGVSAAVTTLVLVARVATRDADDTTPAERPSPSVTVVPTTLPRPLPKGSNIAPGTVLVPGTYFVDEVAGIPTPRIFATLGAGWSNLSTTGWHIAKSDDNWTFEELTRDSNMTSEEAFDEQLQHAVGVMEFSHPVAVYSDACHPGDGNHPGPLHTVDGLVAALGDQQGWAEVTATSDISIDGYLGKEFQRTAPTDMSDCDIRSLSPRVPDDVPGFPDFRSWENAVDPAGWAGFYYEPGWIETLWVLDLDGTMVVISTGVWPEPSAGADADFAADVLDSIRIERADEAN